MIKADWKKAKSFKIGNIAKPVMPSMRFFFLLEKEKHIFNFLL